MKTGIFSVLFVATLVLAISLAESFMNGAFAQTTVAPTTTTFVCPSANPVMCWDNSCALTQSACPCQSGQTVCPTINMCVLNMTNRTQCPCPSGTTQCADNSCATACTQACTSTQIRCNDGTCQNDQSACECPPAQWQNATVIVGILVGTRTTIDVTQTTTVGSSLVVFACGANRTASGSTNWTVTDNTDSSKSFTVIAASSVTLSFMNLIAGHFYTVTAVTVLTYPLAAAGSAPKGSKTWSFTATQPALAVNILGGSQITAATTGSVQFVASLTRNSVVQIGIAVTWSCQCAAGNAGCTACPSAITTAFSQTSSTSVTVSSLNQSAAGAYAITATAGGVTSANQTLTIVAPDPTGAVPPTISILSTPTDAQLRGSDSFSVFARSDVDGVTWVWRIDGITQSSTTNVLIVSPSGLTAGVTHTITVTGTLNGLSATASISFMRPASITGSCTISSLTTPIVGLQTMVTVASTWANADSSVQYTFSYRGASTTNTADETPLATSATLSSTFSFTAPLVKGASESVNVFVRARSGVRTVAVTQCMFTVTAPPTAWVTTQLVDNASAKVAAAESSGDFQTLLAIAKSMATASESTTVSTTAKDTLQQGSVNALNALNNKIAKSQQEREGTLNVLSSLVSSTGSSSSAVVTNITSSALDLILKVVTPPTAGTDSSSTIDAKRGGQIALNILSSIGNQTGITNFDKFTQSCNFIAQTVASQSELGVTSTVASADGKLKAVGVSTPGGSAFSLNFTESNISLPAGMNLGNAGNKVSLAAAVWTDADSAKKQGGNTDQGKPLIGGMPSSSVSSVVDISVSLDGQKQTVTGLAQPISIDLSANKTDSNGQAVDPNSLSCYFYDNGARAWSTTGVSNGPSSNAQQDNLHINKNCKTTHLTLFTVFATVATTTVSAPTTTAAPTTSTAAGNPRVQFTISAAGNATGNVTAAMFAFKLATALGIPGTALAVAVTSTGVLQVEFTSGANATAQAMAALSLYPPSIGAIASASLPPAPATSTTTVAPTTTAPTTSTTTTSTSTTTTPQTSLPPATQITYAPLPSTLNDTVIQVNTSNVQPSSPLVNISTADNLNNISQILQALQTQQMQATNAQGVTLLPATIPSTKLFVPYQGLGEFIVLPTQVCKFNSKLDFRVDSSGMSVQILATSSGSTADVEYAVKSCVAFNPSQATIDRNISAQKFLGVQVQSGTEQATTAMALNTLVFNTGPKSSVLTHNCSTNVPRGTRFVVDLGFVFTHALGLPMTITATGADLFPLPTTIKSVQNSSGFVTVRGTISDTEPLKILFIATDSLTPAVQAICTITPVFVTLRLKNPMMIPYDIHAGLDFNFYIPPDMFESSSPFWIDYVTQKNGLPLPNGVSFQKPWSIAGRMPAVGLFNWTAFAADDFNEARGYILINSTNSAPRVAVSEPHDLGLAFAARDMSLEIDLSGLFVDSDNDALKYYMNTTELARIPWLRANVAPGGFTKTPQKLTLTGSVPRTARGTNFTLQLYCSDGYNETVLVTVLRIAQGAAPIQIKALPSYTIAPEDVLSEQLAMSDYFVLPDGDQMIVTYTLQPVVTWVTITNNPAAGGAPPTLAVAASVTQIEDTEDFIIVTVSNALGDSVNATVSIYVRRTQWQKIQALIIALSAAIGVITSVVGTVVYWPHMVNTYRGRRLVKKCPLHHTTPRFQFPEETDRFECSVRGEMVVCGVDLYKGAVCFSHYLYNYLSQKPTPNSGPPDWLSVRDRHIVLELPPPPKDDIGVKVVLCRFWKEQDFLIEEFEVNFDECYDSYVYDENQIVKNEMFTGEKANAGAAVVAVNVRELMQQSEPADQSSTMLSQSLLRQQENIAVPYIAPSEPPAVSKATFNALELELVETKALQAIANERLSRELYIRDQELAKQRQSMKTEIERRDQEMLEMRNIIQGILGRDGEQRPPNPLSDDEEFVTTTSAPRRSTNTFAPSANGSNLTEFVMIDTL